MSNLQEERCEQIVYRRDLKIAISDPWKAETFCERHDYLPCKGRYQLAHDKEQRETAKFRGEKAGPETPKETLVEMAKDLRVEMGSDAYASCFCHALSTEHEEIMGLLIGTFQASTESADSVTCKIFMSMVLTRSDKRKDRVEIPAEMMAGVASEVEKISKEVGINDLQVSVGVEPVMLFSRDCRSFMFVLKRGF